MGETRYLKCVNLYFGPDLSTGNGEKAYTVLLPVSEFYFRLTNLDMLHPVFLSEEFLAVYV